MNKLLTSAADAPNSSTCASSNQSVALTDYKRIPKTPAERSRSYRERQRFRKAQTLKENERKMRENVTKVKANERSRRMRKRNRLAVTVRSQPVDVLKSEMNDISELYPSPSAIIIGKPTSYPYGRICIKDCSGKTAAEPSSTPRAFENNPLDSEFLESDLLPSINDSISREKIQFLGDQVSSSRQPEISLKWPTFSSSASIEVETSVITDVTKAPLSLNEATNDNSDFYPQHDCDLSEPSLNIKEEFVDDIERTISTSTSLFHHEKNERKRAIETSFIPPELAEEDDDLLFFKSLLPHVRKIPDSRKLTFRNKVQELVDYFAYKNVFEN